MRIEVSRQERLRAHSAVQRELTSKMTSFVDTYKGIHRISALIRQCDSEGQS